MFINGIFGDEKAVKSDVNQLVLKLGAAFNNQNLNVNYLFNPSHLAGLGDLGDSLIQKIFDFETLPDYDLVEILKQASEKVRTQKLLLVGHSQGNFYANNVYDTLADKPDGLPANSLGVYSVATPAGRVAGEGSWITSDTDQVISGLVAKFPLKEIKKPNTHIELQKDDNQLGHDFSTVYLKYQGAKIVSDIQNALAKLQSDETQSCIAAPRISLTHRVAGTLLQVVDPVAEKLSSGTLVADISKLFAFAPSPASSRPSGESTVSVNLPESKASMDSRFRGNDNGVNDTLKPEEDLSDQINTQEPPEWHSELYLTSKRELTLQPSAAATVSVRLENTGNTVWKKDSVSMNTWKPNTDQSLWYDPSWATRRRPALLKENEIKPGEVGTFTFSLTAPKDEDDYNVYFRPVYSDETGFHWLGPDPDLSWNITIEKPAEPEIIPEETPEQALPDSTPNGTVPTPESPIAPEQSPTQTSIPETPASPSLGGPASSVPTSAPSDETPIEFTHPRSGAPLATPGLAAVTLRAPFSSATQISFQWQTPTDAATISYAALYDLRYLATANPGDPCSLDETTWESATQVSGEPTPTANPGEQVSLSASVALTGGTKYCFGLKTYNGTQFSPLSNIVSFTPSAGMTFVDGGIVGSVTWTLANSPYLLGTVLVGSGSVLTIEPGVVIKAANGNSLLSISGTGELHAQGTALNPIVFTEARDDTYAGDTNADGNATAPSPRAWAGVVLEQSGGSASLLDNVIIRYGGNDLGPTAFGNLSIQNINGLNLSNLTLEYGDIGLSSLDASSFTLNGGRIANNTTGISMPVGGSLSVNQTIFDTNASDGINTINAAVSLTNSQFTGNNRPVHFSNARINQISGNTFNGNLTNGVWLEGALSGTLSNAGAPYILEQILIGNGYVVTIDPGVVLKEALPDSGLFVFGAGTVTANGTPGNPIVFTELRDDSYGGDTNNDGAATSPAPRSWIGILISQPTLDSTLSNAIIRYGGNDLGFGAGDLTLDRLPGPTTTLTFLTLENADEGLHLNNGSPLPDISTWTFNGNTVNIFP